MMPIDWESVRCRGDAADVRELFEVYRVGDYLATAEENRRRQDLRLRERLLQGGVRLTNRLSPRIYAIYAEVRGRLEFGHDAEIFCVPDQEINAFAALDVGEDSVNALVGVTSAALEKLEDAELRSILGHELGHLIFGNNRLNALLNADEENPAATVLPAFGESLFLRWRKKAELSCDRVGLVASGDFPAAARSLIKATFGLSERNLNLDIEALLAQIDEIKGRPEMVEEAFASHPMLPIRLKALEIFSRSRKARGLGLPAAGRALSDKALEDQVDELLVLTRRHPAHPLGLAVMELTALGGALLLTADADVSDEEVKVLIGLLHRNFTDEPELVLKTDRKEIEAALPAAIGKVNELGGEDDKTFVLSRLADVALADGALMEPEGATILEIAKALGVPERFAYSIMVGAAQGAGFRTDTKLNRIASETRAALRTGFRSPTERTLPR